MRLVRLSLGSLSLSLTSLVLLAALSPVACGGSSGYQPITEIESQDTPEASSTPSERDASVGGPPATEADAEAPLPECDVSPADDPRVVRDECGVFVAPFVFGGDDAAPGTKAEPLATLTKALLVARERRVPRVYACAATYEETLTLDEATDGVSLIGGLSCPPRPESRDGAWQFDAQVRVVVKPSPGLSGPAIYVRNRVRPTRFENMEIVAPDGTAEEPSSIALRLVSTAPVTLLRTRVAAGKGADGADGATGHPATTQGVSNPGGNAVWVEGGRGAIRQCWNGVIRRGGHGGSYPTNIRQPGTAGEDPNYVGGNAGTVEACAGRREGGGDGHDGVAGADGAGAKGPGRLAEDYLWASASGEIGESGAAGRSGGGGASGATGGSALAPDSGGGGGGGAGGCGGGGGEGGRGGGASISVIAIATKLHAIGSELNAATAGRGGHGGMGALGEPGGSGGHGYEAGCDGGRGGHGGKGGLGGGGAGGLSAGVVSGGDAIVTLDNATRVTVASPAPGGTGGRPGVNDGTAGTSKTVFVVSNK